MQMASDILFQLTGRQWSGECSDTIRPPARCGCPVERCGCGHVSEYRLPGFPVIAVDQVLVDGEIVPPERYRIDNNADLVYMPNPDDWSEPIGAWPWYQRAELPPTERYTWQVSYTYGQPPPIGGVIAAAALGCQLALSWLPKGHPDRPACQLPSRVTNVVRQNVTLAIIDPLTLFRDGQTGLTDVDLWLNSVILGEERKPASVFVPGRRPGARRRTS